MNKIVSIGVFLAALVSCAQAAPVHSRSGVPQGHATRDTHEMPTPERAGALPSAGDRYVQQAFDIAISYAGSYQSREASFVEVFCSDRFSTSASLTQNLADVFVENSAITLKSIKVQDIASSNDMVLVRANLEWILINAKTKASSTSHTSRIFRVIRADAGWAVDDDRLATDDVGDVARELVTNPVQSVNGIRLDDRVVCDALVSALVIQANTQYMQKYDYYHAVSVFTWATRFAEKAKAKATGTSQSLATALSWLAYAEVNAGNYAAATGDKPASESFYQHAIKQYQDYLSLVQREPAVSTPAATMAAHDWIGGAYEGLRQNDQALFYRKMVLHESTDQKNGAMIADALEAVGQLLAQNGNRSDVLKFYEDYIQQRRAANDKMALAAALCLQGSLYCEEGNYATALSNFEEAIKLEKDIGDKNGVASAWMLIGGLYDYQVDFADAENSYKQAQAIYESTHSDLGVADVWRCISHVDYEQGQFSKSLEDGFKGLKIAGQEDNLAELVRLYSCIGSTLQSQGNYRQATNFLQACEQNSAILNDSVFENSARGALASLFLYQGDYDQALEQMAECNTVSGRVSDPHELLPNPRMMANIWDKKGDDTQALRYIQQAIELSQSHGPSWEVAAIYESLGNILAHQGNLEKSIEAYARALEMARAAKAWPIAVTTQDSIGETYSREGKFAEALQQYQEALKRIEPSDLVDLSSCYADIGYAYFRLNQYDSAAQACHTAIQYIDTMRSQVAGGPREQQLFFQNQLSPYQTLTLILLAQHRDQEAFSCWEQSKACVVRTSFEHQPVMTALTPDESAQSHSLSACLASLDRQVFALKREGATAARLGPLENSQARARLEYELWKTILDSRHSQPELPPNDQPISCDDAYQLLPNEGTALLEYAVLGNATYLFLLTKHDGQPQFNVYRIYVSADQLGTLVKQFRNGVADGDESSEFYAEARHLFEVLLGGPVRDRLKGVTTLCIVPDGPLWNLPFQALQSGKGRYVIDDQAVFFAPSLTALREMRRKRYPPLGQNAPRMLAVGNPALAGGSKAVTGLGGTVPTTKEAMSDLFRPLPQAETQVRNIAALYGKSQCKMLVGEDANEERVKSEIEKYQVLQFATHGVADLANPLYSYLLLSQAHGKAGTLYAADVMEMHLQARLVVLAACDTAHGQVSPGEGLIGMTWAFLHAGCPHVVSSQWQIDAGSTTKLMVAFHNNLRTSADAGSDGSAIVDALRKAALKLRHTELYSHPYYWAPFVLTGDGLSGTLLEPAVTGTKQ